MNTNAKRRKPLADNKGNLDFRIFLKKEIDKYNKFKTAHDNVISKYEKLIDKLYEFAPVIIVITDIINLEAPFVYVNKFAQQELGYPITDITLAGQKFLKETLHPSEKFSFAKKYLHFVTQLSSLSKEESEKLVLNQTNRIKHSKGSYIWFDIKTMLLSMTSKGEPHLTLSIISNIDEIVRLRLERQIVFDKELSMLKNRISEQKVQLQSQLLNSIENDKSYDDIIKFINKLGYDSDTKTSNLLEQIIGYIKRNKPQKNIWEEFVNKFQEVNPQFIKTLTEKYPDLTSTEIKICALTSIGLNSKDIANMLKLSSRSIENHKYNIRKKFKLEPYHNFIVTSVPYKSYQTNAMTR